MQGEVAGKFYWRDTLDSLILYFHQTSFYNTRRIAAAAGAVVQLKNNQFSSNKGGNPIFFHNNDVIDLGGNILLNNDGCNGAFIEREGHRCLYLNGQVKPTPVTPPPTYSPIALPADIGDHSAPRGGTGYFNYNPVDNVYGPSFWGDVKDNPEHIRYQELMPTLQRSLRNKCEKSSSKQSPIDVCEDKINAECEE